MKLPISYESINGQVTDLVLRKINGEAIAATSRLSKQGEEYPAIAAFLEGAIASVTAGGVDSSDKEAIKVAVRAMPWSLCEWVLIQALVLSGIDPVVDILYECPRCEKQFERTDDEVRIDRLPFGGAFGDGQPGPVEVEYELKTPVEMKDARTGEVIESVEKVAVRLGTLADCIRERSRTADDVRMQYAVWFASITKVNGVEVEDKWRPRWSGMLFEKMDSDDLHGFSDAVSIYSMDNEIDAVCPKCGKAFRQEVPANSFFASGLRRLSRRA